MHGRFRSHALVLSLLCLLPALAADQARRPISPADFDGWRSISGQTLSPDGKYLAYAYMPEDGDGDLIVRELASGREWRLDAGALPPPPVTPGDPETPPPPRTLRIVFTSDSSYAIAGTYPLKVEVEQAKREHQRAADMPKQGLLILQLRGGEVTRVSGVKSFQVPEKGGDRLAYLKEAPIAAHPPEGAGQARPAAASARAAFGTDLVLRDLAQGAAAERTFAAVSEFALARDGRTLVYAVSSQKEEDNGVFAVWPGKDAAPVALASGKGKYSKLAWDRGQETLGFIFDTSAFLWHRGASSASEVVTAKTPGIPVGMAVSDKAALSFSRDGKRLFVPVARPGKSERPSGEAEPTAPADDKVVMDLWRWNDDYVQPMQKVRATQERNRTYRGVFHIDSGQYVQLATAEMQNVLPTDDGLYALGLDDRPYRRLIDFDRGYEDVYLIDSTTGKRRAVLHQLPGGAGSGAAASPLQIAPDGRHAFYYNDRAWWLLSLPEGGSSNVTSALPAPFHDETEDTPGPPSSYGHSGWAKDSQSFFVNDRYDVWQIFADGRPALNLTFGLGRAGRIQFRIVRVEPVEEEGERGLDTTRPVIYRAESESTRDSGFYQAVAGSLPTRLLWGPADYRYLARARLADVLLITASRFDLYPDLQVTDSRFSAPHTVTSGGSQLNAFTWGTSELVSFHNADGVPLQAALYKPARFEPARKYPLLVYIYERLSQNVHHFVEPHPGHNINISQYVSDGYLVLTPDIVYTIGAPGQSALKCVLPAIQAVVDKGYIDQARIGIQGHSWGGYQVAYMVTQTDRFRAAEAGAPVGNMTSAYGGIRWGTGLPRQFQYEQSQSRIGPSLYNAPLNYIENSPVFFIERVRTPLLILDDDNDDAVPWFQGIEFFLALRRNGKQAYLMNYNGEFHSLRRRADQKDYTMRMKQFFDHFLKDAPIPEWMEKGIPYIDREDEKERFEKSAEQ